MSETDENSPNISDMTLGDLKASDFNTITKAQRDLILKTKVENSYRSCCGGRIDKRLIVISVQGVISLSIMGFCFYQMSDGKNSDLTASLLSSLLAYWLGRNSEEKM